MDFEFWLKYLADFLITAGVPAEHAPMAALGLVFACFTLLSLLIALLLLRKNFRSGVADGEIVDGPDAEVTESSEGFSVAEEIPSIEAENRGDEESQSSSVLLPTDDVSPGLLQRMQKGLAKTRTSLVSRMAALLGSHTSFDDEFLEELEEILITADFGMRATQELVQAMNERLKVISGQVGPGQLHAILGEEVRARLKNCEPNWLFPERGPLVILVVGVNGVGKTTTIGKLAKQFADQGKKVVLGAGDTFRAAAAEQLEVWGKRAGAEVIRHNEGSDPGAVVFDAAKAAVARSADVLILDTAGRLHTKVNLMEELKKVRRIVAREIPGAPHETLLVLDATTGQNALIQARMFQEAVEVSGIALTKLDGTAKGGIVVAINSQLDLPVRLIGIGEGVADLRPFDADEFVAALFANN